MKKSQIMVYVTNARIPTEKAHGYQICKMCEQFANLGIDVRLWLPGRESGIEDTSYSYYGLRNNFSIKKFRVPSLINESTKIGYFLYDILFSLRILISRMPKDAIVYTRGPLVAFFASLRRKKVIYEAHTWPESKRNFFVFLLKRVEKIVVITNALKTVFVENGFDGESILVAPDGVDVDQFNIDISKKEARKKLNLSENKKIVMYTGHLYDWKGVGVLARAADSFSSQYLFVFVGGTKDDVVSFREKNKSRENVLSVGHLPHSDIPYYLKAADVLVLPNSSKLTISRDYTSPLKLFEYMASGRPIVCSDLPSIREILKDEEAVWVEPDSVPALAEGIASIFSDYDSTEIMGQKYRDRLKKLSWRSRATQITSFFS